MQHIVKRPRGLQFRNCRHKPTDQQFAVLTEDGSVETKHGTMTFRKGDVLMIGSNGKTLYTLAVEDFKDAYDPQSM